MKIIKIFLPVLILLFSLNLYPQTQSDMTYAALQDYKLAETELNDIFSKILKEYKADKVFIKNLKVSQKQWIKFRDAEVRLKFPDYNSKPGTAHSMCQLFYLKDLTETRIASLKKWLSGAEEGDVCAGSIKVKN